MLEICSIHAFKSLFLFALALFRRLVAAFSPPWNSIGSDIFFSSLETNKRRIGDDFDGRKKQLVFEKSRFSRTRARLENKYAFIVRLMNNSRRCNVVSPVHTWRGAIRAFNGPRVDNLEMTGGGNYLAATSMRAGNFFSFDVVSARRFEMHSGALFAPESRSSKEKLRQSLMYESTGVFFFHAFRETWLTRFYVSTKIVGWVLRLRVKFTLLRVISIEKNVSPFFF